MLGPQFSGKWRMSWPRVQSRCSSRLHSCLLARVLRLTALTRWAGRPRGGAGTAGQPVITPVKAIEVELSLLQKNVAKPCHSGPRLRGWLAVSLASFIPFPLTSWCTPPARQCPGLPPPAGCHPAPFSPIRTLGACSTDGVCYPTPASPALC